MNLLTHRSPHAALCCAVALSLVMSCGDDSDDGGTPPGGSGGTAGSGGSGGSGGTAAGAGGVAGSAGSAGSGGTGVVPDASKDCGAAADPSVPALKLTQVVSGLEKPVFLTQPPGDTARLFVIEKPGRVRIVRDGALVEAPFLTVPGVTERFDELGLLGLAFHPDYAQNGRFYVFYSTIIGDQLTSRLAEYRVSSDDLDVADPASERVLLEIEKPEDNHNGGDITFGPDGFLYVGVGDGGGGGDQHGDTGNGQNLQVLLGKILRIDVNGTGAGANGNYSIPAGNLAADEALPEIWSYGLRNPWRYSFDGCTGDMYIGDVGQNEIEEIDFEPAGTPGRNYGWRLMEGAACFNPDSGCDAAADNLVLPVATYTHDVGVSITGGYVYRGAAIPNLRGTYIYADYQSARFFALRMSGGSVSVQQTEITDNINAGTATRITSFGQDNVGNVYVLSYGGQVYRIDAE
jgi:glucose/arabinose dehydrogenase